LFQKLIFEKIKDLEVGNFSNDKALKGKHKGKCQTIINMTFIMVWHLSLEKELETIK